MASVSKIDKITPEMLPITVNWGSGPVTIHKDRIVINEKLGAALGLVNN